MGCGFGGLGMFGGYGGLGGYGAYGGYGGYGLGYGGYGGFGGYGWTDRKSIPDEGKIAFKTKHIESFQLDLFQAWADVAEDVDLANNK
ncbi:unnamed protein product [Haemonchus placei]|uniref:Glycine rich superfamily member n=1 Tax=Haemonchus placei TaxID=6290 RepID=A0A0N4WPV6_HAEPC|nr:unnamed protein product [Haemonchus placei]